MDILTKPRADIIYPESDGTPMGETDKHINLLLYLRQALRDYFRNDSQVYVAGNLFLYYEEGNPSAVVAPDIFVVKGVSNEDRRTYRLWEEEKGPDVVFELTSKSTRLDDLGTKRALYAMLGVSEYYIFDPFSEYLEPQLWAYHLESGTGLMEYVRIFDDVVYSPILNLEMYVEGDMLRLQNPQTSKKLLTALESQAAYRTGVEALQIKDKALQDKDKALRTELEARRAAEADTARLREELAQLKAQLSNED